jgi:hypothetical protein
MRRATGLETPVAGGRGGGGGGGKGFATLLASLRNSPPMPRARFDPPLVEGEGGGRQGAASLSEPVARGMSDPVARGMSEPVARGMSEPVARGMSEPVARGVGQLSRAAIHAADSWTLKSISAKT